MDLYLIRHGHAQPFGPDVRSDADRSLTAPGRDLITRAGPSMRSRGIAPAVILTSPFLRALQTAELLQEFLEPAEGTLIVPPLASGAQPETLLDVATDHQTFGAVMVVGHNPEMDAAVRSLASRAGTEAGPMRPATLAWFRNADLPPKQALAFEGQWDIESWGAERD